MILRWSCDIAFTRIGLGQVAYSGFSTNQLFSNLNIKVHQFSLSQQVVYLPGLQPAMCLFLPAAQVDENSQTDLGIVKSGLVRPENIDIWKCAVL